MLGVGDFGMITLHDKRTRDLFDTDEAKVLLASDHTRRMMPHGNRLVLLVVQAEDPVGQILPIQLQRQWDGLGESHTSRSAAIRCGLTSRSRKNVVFVRHDRAVRLK